MNPKTPQSLRLEKSAVQEIIACTRKVFVFIEGANITSSFNEKSVTLSSTPAVLSYINLSYIKDSYNVPVEHYQQITDSIAKLVIPLKYDTIES